MHKKVIALAIAGLVSSVALAQSNITIYGVADANWYYARGGDNNVTGVGSGDIDGSHIGFKGEEALGNGLKTIFTMEFGTDIDSNSALNTTRQAFVGLSTSIGDFTLGRQYAPSFMYMARNSSNELTLNQPAILMLDDVIDGFVGGTMTAGDGSRWDNAVVYQSPNWSGFETRIAYGFGENVRNSSVPNSPSTMDDGRFGISGGYSNGPFNIDLIYQTRINVSTAGVKSSDDIDEWFIGGAYDFDVAKFFASYQKSATDYSAANSDRKAKLWSIGVAVSVSNAGTVSLEYAESRYQDDTRTTDGKTRGLGVAYMHELSKRTMLYSGLGYLKNKDKNGAGSSLPLGNKGIGVSGEDNWSITTGIFHTF